MSKVLLCMGRYATKPYFVERVYVNVYSIEELCYCLVQNIYLIDEEIMNSKLIDWIEKECELQELSAALTKLCKKKEEVSVFITAILTFAGYHTKEEINQAENNLKNNVSLSTYEKKKARADYFAENGKYVLALKNYDILLEELPETEAALKGKVYHNRGVIYAWLFEYESAKDSFREAYECDKSQESYIQYLAANRMQMEEAEYVNFVAGQTKDYELALEVEKMIENADKQFVSVLKEYKEENISATPYEETDRITDELKEKYREFVME